MRAYDLPMKRLAFAIAIAAHNARLIAAKAALGSDKLRDRSMTPLMTHSVQRVLAATERKTKRAAPKR